MSEKVTKSNLGNISIFKRMGAEVQSDHRRIVRRQSGTKWKCLEKD